MCSFGTNVAATLLQRLTKYISCGKVDDTSSQSREVIVNKAENKKICEIFNNFCFLNIEN